MSEPIQKYTISLTGDNSEFVATLKETQNALQTYLQAHNKEITNFAQKAVKDYKKIMGTIDATTEAVKKLRQGFKLLIKVVGGYVSFNFAKKIFGDIITMGNNVALFSNSTGIAVENVTRLGLALERFGGNTENAQNTLGRLQQELSNYRDFGSGVFSNWQVRAFGVDPVSLNTGKLKSAEETLLSIATAMEKLNHGQQRSLGQMFGFDDATIMLLQSGRKEVEKTLAMTGSLAMTSEDAAISRSFTLALWEIKASLLSIARVIVRNLSPLLLVLGKILSGLAKIIVKVGEKMRQVFQVIALGTLPLLILKFLSLTKVLKVIPILLKAIGHAGAFALKRLLPLLIGSLVLEDFVVFLAGGKSVIGEILGEKNSETVRQFFTKLKDLLQELAPLIELLFKPIIIGLQLLIDLIQYIPEFLDSIEKSTNTDVMEMAKNYTQAYPLNNTSIVVNVNGNIDNPQQGGQIIGKEITKAISTNASVDSAVLGTALMVTQ